jgi:hypothetical protein
MKNALLVLALLAGCATTGQVGEPRPRQNKVDPTAAVVLLQAARFDEAEAKAREILAADPLNSQANVVAAFAVYKRTMHQIVQDFFSLVEGLEHSRSVNYQYAKYALSTADERFSAVEKYLATAGSDSNFSLELCLACWQYDWNHSGSVDYRDEALFQIEVDAEGHDIPEGDPRRKPTFRFDVGDIHWARAMVMFQHAAANILLAYDFSDLDKIAQGDLLRGQPSSLTLRLADKARMQKAKTLILDGLSAAELARKLYLAETDDVNEWVANPRQKNHPLPLPVDEALYETWAEVLADVRQLVSGKEGLSITELAQLGDHQWQNPPKGYLDLGLLLEQPSDIVFNVGDLGALDRSDGEPTAIIEKILHDLFGEKYRMAMSASLLPGRFHRMKKEIESGHESLERKLRYLLWLN